MPRRVHTSPKAARKAVKRSGPPKAPTPKAIPRSSSPNAVTADPNSLARALLAARRRISSLETDVGQLTGDLGDLIASVQLRDQERLQRESQEFQKIYARIAVISDRLAEIDGREERLKAAIDSAAKAAKVLERVELGLRPMLVKAIEAEKAHTATNWMQQQIEAEFTAQNYGSGPEPMDAHIRAYYIHQSSLRS